MIEWQLKLMNVAEFPINERQNAVDTSNLFEVAYFFSSLEGNLP